MEDSEVPVVLSSSQIRSMICIEQKKKRRKKRTRSIDAQKRRDEKKELRNHTIETVVPQTELQKRQVQQHELKLIHLNTTIKDVGGEIFVRLFVQVIPQHLIQNLENSLQQLILQVPPKVKQNSRGKSVMYTLGCLRKCQAKPYLTTQTKNEHSIGFLKKNAELISLVNKIFEEQFPSLYMLYKSIELPERYLGAFATLTINVNYQMKKHIDEADFPNGYCWLLTCGKYEGGHLYLNDMNMNIDASPGNLIAFKSKKLSHQCSTFTGQRYSFVFYTHNNLFC